MPSAKRDQLVNTAQALFQKHGYHATGIDTILEKSGVAKRTLYKHFSSKDDLISAVLEAYDESFRDEFFRAVESAASTPRARLLAVFDQAEKWFSHKNFFGCLFVKAAGEFPDKRTDARALCRRAKTFFTDYLETQAREAGAKHPASLAAHLALLFEGAIVTALISGDSGSARAAKSAARILINYQLRN